MGLAGVLWVLQPGATEITLGHISALICAISGAFASIVVRKIGREERSVVLLLYPMVANFLLMGALLPFVYVPMPVEHLGMLFMASLMALVASGFLIRAYRMGEAAVIAPMQYSQILWATLYGTLLFNETPDQNTAIGAAVIIASGLYIVLRESRGGTSENTPVLRTRSRVGTPTTPRISVLLRPGESEEDPEAERAPGQIRPHMRGLPGRAGRS